MLKYKFYGFEKSLKIKIHVTYCNDLIFTPKVFQNDAVIHDVKIVIGVFAMYMLPGCYNFNDSKDIICKFLREMCDSLVYKFYRYESGMNF